jgi:hypothetical protein
VLPRRWCIILLLWVSARHPRAKAIAHAPFAFVCVFHSTINTSLTLFWDFTSWTVTALAAPTDKTDASRAAKENEASHGLQDQGTKIGSWSQTETDSGGIHTYNQNNGHLERNYALTIKQIVERAAKVDRDVSTAFQFVIIASVVRERSKSTCNRFKV